MAIAESILPEFDRETAVTRMLLERVPDQCRDWKPHPKSYSLGELSSHIANLLNWASIAIERVEFDPNPPDGPRHGSSIFESTAQLLQTYDDRVRSARALLVRTTDGEFMVPWTLKNSGKTIFSMPRVAVFRSFVLNHTIHHRGQLTVYLRLLDVPLPNIYGPTADTR